MSEKGKIMLDFFALFVYYMRVGSKPTAHGEVAQLAERARLEIVYTPKGYRGFKSLLLRHKKSPIYH